MTDLSKLALIFLLSFLICAFLIVLRKHYMPLLRDRNDLGARQALHRDVTPRLGGVGIMLAIVFAMQILPRDLTLLFSIFALSLIPVVVTGLAEDIGFRVSPRGRLIGAAASSLIMITFMNIWIPATSGVFLLDLVLQVTPLAIAGTVLWTTGICHGFNLIDGVNGLSTGIGVMIAAALWWLSFDHGQTDLARVCLAMVPALLGFLVFNWPFGKIFLGDAGAYGVGHVLVWLGILLAWNVSDISALALALMFFWPVADTLLAIWRRKHLRKPVDEPDRMHFHQLIYRGLTSVIGRQVPSNWINSMTGFVLLPFAGAPILVAVLVHDDSFLAFAAWCVFSTLFVVTYLVGVASFRTRRRFIRDRSEKPKFAV